MVDPYRLLDAFEKARAELLSRRDGADHWTGELSSSALSTATAVSALALVKRHGEVESLGGLAGQIRQAQLDRLIVGGLRYLADHQNEDGGWGDTDKSQSNIATTMLVVAAFHLTGVPGDRADLLSRGEQYIESHGGVAALRRRYGRDKTFAVPILTNCALAGMVSWREVSALPFELACFPQKLYRFLRLPVVSYAIPALVAIGQARYFHRKPLNPITRLVRSCSVEKSLKVLRQMQPASGGYLEAAPLTSFIVMSLASIGRVDHEVTQNGVKFLVSTARPDGSWPIDTNLATWNTTLAINALAGGGEDVAELECLDWLLNCQHREVHPYTDAEPGGWGWSDLSGAVPDADDTPGALLALSAWANGEKCSGTDRERIREAARAGVNWLFQLQNADGGWPTFCRGWGKLPFDRSGSDLTAHAIRALHAWRDDEELDQRRIDAAIKRGMQFLEERQRADGSWTPLWFGNQDDPNEENPVYGTARVLAAYRDLDRLRSPHAWRGLGYLVNAQTDQGDWGNVEQTTLATEALLAADGDESMQTAAVKGLRWLLAAVERDEHKKSSPIGFYFAKLWYYEDLYPLTFTVSVLGRAVRQQYPDGRPKPTRAHLSGT